MCPQRLHWCFFAGVEADPEADAETIGQQCACQELLLIANGHLRDFDVNYLALLVLVFQLLSANGSPWEPEQVPRHRLGSGCEGSG